MGGGFRPAMGGGFHPAMGSNLYGGGGFRPGAFGNPAPGIRPNGLNPYGASNFARQAPISVPRNEFNNAGIRGNGFNRNINLNNINDINRIGNNSLAINRGNIGGVRAWNNGVVGDGRWNYNRPFYGYHNNWVNGYWPGHYGGYGGWGGWGYGGLGYGGWGYGGYGLGGLGLGMLAGLGVGAFGAWGLNPYSYGWGYSSYANPFYGVPASALAVGQPISAGGVVPTAYDYNLPLDTTSAVPADDVVNPAVTTFDQARDAFKAGDYPRALDLINQTIKTLPNDADAHEFRALTLFALGQYKDAATTLYAVLSSGPGWDWTTLIMLYPNVDVYTQQLRALEQYRTQNPNDPSARFVLAYLYTCQGANSAAAAVYDALAKLLPNDPLIPRLQRTVTGDASTPGENTQANPTPGNPAAPATTGPTFDLTGTWKASPNSKTTITLTRNADGTFTWDVATNGQSKPIRGTSQYQDGVLALSQENGPPLAGKVTWEGPNKFNFRLVGNGPEDPGLNFGK
jgi:tetratricopeptide (TPR) repeat protein